MHIMIQRGVSKYPIIFNYSFKTCHDHTKEINNPQMTHSLVTDTVTKLLPEVYFAPAIQRAENFTNFNVSHDIIPLD